VLLGRHVFNALPLLLEVAQVVGRVVVLVHYYVFWLEFAECCDVMRDRKDCLLAHLLYDGCFVDNVGDDVGGELLLQIPHVLEVTA